MQIPRSIQFVVALIIICLAWGLVANLSANEAEQEHKRIRDMVCQGTKDPLVALKNCR